MVINIYEQICALFMRARNWKPPEDLVLWNDYVNHDIYSCEGIECNH